MAFWLGLLSVIQKIKQEEVGYHRYFAREKKENTPTEIYAIKMHEQRMVSAAFIAAFSTILSLFINNNKDTEIELLI